MFDFVSQPVIFILLYLAFSFLFILIILSILRWWLHGQFKQPAAFRKVILLITVPKEEIKAEERERFAQRRETIAQRISVADLMYTALASLRLPRGFKSFLFGRHDTFALELVADKEGLVSFYAAVPQYMQRYFEQQVHAQYPAAHIEKVEDYNIFTPQGIVIGASLTLQKKFIFPILTYDKMENDPLNALTNVLSKFEKHEGAAIQFVLRTASPGWHYIPAKVATVIQQGKKLKQALREVTANPILRALRYTSREVFKRYRKQEMGMDIKTERPYQLSPMEQEVVKSLEDKATHAGFGVNIRVVVSALDKNTAEFKLNNILSAFGQFTGFEYLNSFSAAKPTTSRKLIHDFIYRHFDAKKAILLNVKEMSSLWHLPLPTTETPNIRWLMAKKAPPPVNMPKDGLLLGEVVYRGMKIPVRIKREDRRRHIYIIGQTGSGKSVLMTNMAIQDIQNGEGVCVIDPHGDLIQDILPNVPKNRIDDIVYFNPADIERPMGLNMLEYETQEQKDFAVQEMVAIFYKLFGTEMIGPMFEHYMRNAMLALMEDKETGATIVEIPRMFTDKPFRRAKLKKVENLIVRNFWEQEYEQSQAGQMAADMLSYVISKIGRFITNDMMRNIIGQVKSGFNLREVMDQQKIILVNLSKGQVGEVNSSLLGLVMVSKIQMAAMARAVIPQEKRKDFYLYIDEFQNYTTDSIATILSEARKYRLNLILAHQYIGQLVVGQDTKIRDAVFGNAGTKIAFRIGVEDAEIMAKEYAPVFDENDVINVEKFTANLKLLIDNTASRPFNMRTFPAPKGNPEIAKAIKELSRLKYGRDRAIVEAEIKERSKLGELGGGGLTGPDSFR